MRPDDGPPKAEYLWHGEVIRDPVSAKAAIGIAKTANGSRPIEIRLLRQKGADETFYSVDLSSYRSALRWRGTPENTLVIRGQVDTAGQFPHASTIVLGQPLRQTMCKVGSIDFCYPVPNRPAAGNGERHQDLGDEVAAEMDRRRAERRDLSDIRFRLHCLLLWESAYVDFVDMGFRDCWVCGGCELRIHAYLAQKLGYRRLHLGFSCGRQARYAPDGAFIRGHRKSLETEPFKLSSELSNLRHTQRLGLPCERLCRYPVGHLASSFLESR